MKASSTVASVRAGFFGILAVVLTGCATYPVSKALREQARPLTVRQVAANPGAYTGAVVIWGGKVINTVNTTNGASISVLALPLTSDERPVRNAVTTGRFIAWSKGFIDPEVFRNGRLVTIAGQITGVAKKPLQGIQYDYPLVSIKELHLWYVPQPYYPYYYPGPYWGWYGPGWSWGGYGPGWGWGWRRGGPGWYWDYP
jgi:outer membrane lipoprotein